MFRPAKVTRQATRTLQTLRGIGQVLQGDTVRCAARYSLTVNQVIVYIGTGGTEIRGTLVLVDAEYKWRAGTKLALKLEDGRRAECVTVGEHSGSRVYAVQVSELSRH